MAPITDCLKSEGFQWIPAASKAFAEIKRMMTEAPVMRLPEGIWSNVWRIRTDNRWYTESGKPPHYLFQWKLNDARQWYFTYDKEFYSYWRHYLLSQEFVLYSDHEALRYLNSQKRLNARHSKWVEFLQDYTFVLKHKACVENKIADVLSRCVMTLVTMST